MTARATHTASVPGTASASFGGAQEAAGPGVGPIVELSGGEIARRLARARRPSITSRLDADAATATGPRILNAATWLAEKLAPIQQLLPGLLDAGAKMLVNGSSKSRKTFVVIQLALCMAAGRRFLKWTPPGACRVLLLQGEVTAAHFHARLVRAQPALNLTLADLGDRLQIVNSRGHFFTLDDPPDWLMDAAADVDLVIVDPVYKFFKGEENSGTDAAAFLRGLDKLTEQSGAAVVYVHHTAKGTAGDRQTIDRGSGSGVFARDFDASLYLGQQKSEDGVLVVEPIVRAYPPTEPFCIQFEDGAFVESDHVPQVQKSSDRRGDQTPPAALLPAIRDILGDATMNKGELIEKLRTRTGVTKKKVGEAVESAVAKGEIESFTGGWPNSIRIQQKSQSADDGEQGSGET